ncbi:hypothetical protein COV20_02605 [Candidatus Woesearchaeota archaeon CG10_big_fil_rev_8_21_14_0_10_45_16]|nr:MAG: hypothetical protein COV20_02605 [Candidatus Woesearchaeota archaeon CG10_big_fil_rev_8_21_14_0_10_45_16]
MGNVPDDLLISVEEDRRRRKERKVKVEAVPKSFQNKPQSQAPQSGQKQSGSVLQKEVTIKINPARIMKGGFFVAVLFLAFFLGQWTGSQDGDDSFFSFLSFSSAAGAAVAENSDSPEAVTEELPVSVEEVPTEEPVVENVTDEAVVEEPAEEELAAEPVEEEEVREEDQELITEYGQVDFALDKVTSQPKDGYGKITRIDVTVTNNADGKVEVSNMLLTLKGYDDYTKIVEFSGGSETIYAGKSIRPSLEVPGGYAYHESVVEDFSRAQVFLTLYDGSGKVIKTISKVVSLN